MKMFFTMGAVAAFTVCAMAQAPDANSIAKYRRSSLHTMMIDNAGLIKADTIKDSFLKAPLPEKYNDHTVGDKLLDIAKYKLTDAEKAALKANGEKQSAFKGFGKALASSATGGVVDATDATELPHQIEKYFAENYIARNLVAKWFNRKENGSFDMDLVGERGHYNATEMQAEVAAKSTRGIAALRDMGEELIANTFVVVTRFNYVDKKEVAKAAKGLLSSVTGVVGGSTAELINQTAGAAMDMAAKGYVVKTNSYLYRLVWDEEAANRFYSEFWMDADNIDPVKKAAFDTTSIFKLEFVGDETAWADVQSSVFSKKSEEELVRVATVRAVDAVIAKLQKKYDVFKTKTPLFSIDPLTAKIGLKEGVEAGDKFDVLEQVFNDETQKTEYVKRGTVTVDKSQIWDNRYMAGEMPDKKNEEVSESESTLFKGGSKKFYQGMLLRQVK